MAESAVESVHTASAVSFPTTFPQESAMKLATFALNPKKPDAEVAAAVYEIAGYGAFLYFGQVPAKIMGIASIDALGDFKARELVNAIRDLLADPAIKDLPLLDIAKDAISLYTAKTPVWLIGVKLVTKYGRAVLPLIGVITKLI